MSLGTRIRNAAIHVFLKGLVRDVQKGEYGVALKNAWQFLDGKKTWIGLIATFLPQSVDLVAQVIRAGGGSPDKFVQLAGIAGVIVGSIHKLVKGD